MRSHVRTRLADPAVRGRQRRRGDPVRAGPADLGGGGGPWAAGGGGGGVAEPDPPPGKAVIIETVGTLVCPALFDRGGAHGVVLAAVTEGPDKPMKYPQMFRQANLVLLTKVDLLPYI